MTRVLVTGAGGFIGRALARELMAAGHDVRALVRREGDATVGTETRVVADVAEAAEQGDVLDDVDVVVHLAARAHRTGETGDAYLERYLEDNAEATRRVALAAARGGATRLIFVSSLKVHGDDGERPCTEDDPVRPNDPYGISKLRAESALAEVRAETGLATVVLRPPLVYGPCVKANFRILLRLADSPFPLPLGGIGKNLRSYVFIGNLLSAIRAAMTEPAAAGRTYLVRDGEDVSTAALVDRLRTVLGRKRRLVPVPVSVLAAAASLLGRGAIMEPLTGSRRVDDSRIRRELGWSPPYTLDQGLAATASWYRGARAGRTP